METKRSPSTFHDRPLPDELAIEAFRRELTGLVLRPGDRGYNRARLVWNGLIDRYPAFIVRCAGVADVISAVNFARDNGLFVSVRGGGHSVAGFAMNDGHLVIDLTYMKGIRVDPARRTVRAQAGVTLGNLDRETQVFGLAVPGGNVSMTGLAGLTLSGGLSWLRRKYGMSVDNLISADVVTADGQCLTVSETDHPDLFWGIRGGGGNFGVITSFEFKLHPVGPQVFFMTTMYPIDRAAEVLRAWRDWTRTAPDEATTDTVIWTIPAVPPFPEALWNTPFVGVGGLYAGPIEEGARTFAPLRTLAEPLIDVSGVQPFLAVQQMFDALFPDGQYYYWKSLYMDDLSDETIDLIQAHAAKRPSLKTLIPIRHLGGAVSRVPDDATPIGYRSAQYLLNIDATWVSPSASEENIAWTRQFYDAVRRFGRGAYLNFGGLGEEDQELIHTAYGKNYDRLVALKEKYDPTNLFRFNHNIKPFSR
jgi:FAD/FMN-containing dehydrogenase